MLDSNSRYSDFTDSSQIEGKKDVAYATSLLSADYCIHLNIQPHSKFLTFDGSTERRRTSFDF